MPYQHAYDQKNHLILVTVTGEVTRKSWEDLLKESLRQAAEHSCYHFLVDYRNADVRLGFVDLYDRPRFYEEVGMPKTARIALILSPHVEDRDFMETVSANRGFAVKVFIEMEPAADWLGRGRRVKP